MSEDLQPLAPREAMEMWLDRQRSEKAEETLQSYYYRIRKFVEWCESDGIENLNELTGRDLYRFDSDQRAVDLNQSTLNNQLGTLKLFIKFCADVEAVPSDLPAKLEVPKLTKGERTNDEKLSAERAEAILENLGRYSFASRDHALFALGWHTGARLGGLRSLDLEDIYLTEDDLDRLRHQDDIDDEILEKVEPPFLYFRHRPPETPLKNQTDGERPVSLSDEIGEVLSEYIEVNRVQLTDDEGRRPLFSTEKGKGRMSKGSIRSRFNIITQPCRYGGCPHGREEASCEALEHGYESRCPSSRSPHPIRTGSITHHRDRGWPAEVLAERVNATPEVIRAHYDHPEQLKRMESRRSFLQNLEEDE
ncbi:tyrosine-type recombinase/integrase [Halorussus marinus]|uniref:tyrosine-type recombinase/integrase n=1 Tax=Halorussus marinus TaxID=2505976 RepID=UPI00106DDCAF|nr:site-specific integrase [Halorussus marinus]